MAFPRSLLFLCVKVKTHLSIVVIVVFALYSRCGVFGAENRDPWIADWPDLSEMRVLVTDIMLDGIVEGGGAFSIKIQTRTIRSSEVAGAAGPKVFGLNRRGKDALNSQMTSMELMCEGRRMEVPKSALMDILNPLIGQSMKVIFSDDKNQIRAVTVDGPDGAEGYMVAFIFENNRFVRRQIRSNASSQDGWPLLQDKKY